MRLLNDIAARVLLNLALSGMSRCKSKQTFVGEDDTPRPAHATYMCRSQETKRMDTPHLSFDISFPTSDLFISHWASKYFAKDSDREREQKLYDSHICTADLKTNWNALEDLFKWKNGVDRIAGQKLASIRANYFNDWTEDADLESRYLNPDKGRGGSIWNICLLAVWRG
jgi:hypothetical protein